MSSASRRLAPREGLECWLMKMGYTRPPVEPRPGPHVGMFGYPCSQDADSSPWAQGALALGFAAKPRVKCGAPRALTTCDLD